MIIGIFHPVHKLFMNSQTIVKQALQNYLLAVIAVSAVLAVGAVLAISAVLAVIAVLAIITILTSIHSILKAKFFYYLNRF